MMLTNYEARLNKMKKLLIILNIIMIIFIIFFWSSIESGLKGDFSYIFQEKCKLEKTSAFIVSGNLDDIQNTTASLIKFFGNTEEVKVSGLYYERCMGFPAEITFLNKTMERFMICKDTGIAYRYSKDCKEENILETYSNMMESFNSTK